MKTLCVLLAAFICAQSIEERSQEFNSDYDFVPDITNRIVGGENASLGDVPHIVSVRARNQHGCGGTIISKDFVLSAAHCFYGHQSEPSLFSIQYGVVHAEEQGPNVLPVKKITMHPNYEHKGNYPNDIALVQIDGEIAFSQYAKAAALPTPFEVPNEEKQALLAGWGYTQSGSTTVPDLQQVYLRVFSDEDCEKSDVLFDPDLHICAGIVGGGKGQCSGDSGGPLTQDGKLVGVVSWSRKPCASAGHPGVFTRVTTHRNWIRRYSGV